MGPTWGEGQGGDHLHPRAPRAPQPEAQARLRQDHRAEPVQVGNLISNLGLFSVPNDHNYRVTHLTG